MKRPPTTGFTLIELLIAIAVFSVMSVFAYQGLRNFLTAREIVDAQAADFDTLVTAMTLMQQDIEESAPRSVRDALGDAEPAIRSGRDEREVLALTRHAAWAAAQPGSSDLKRIEYVFEDGVLIRRVWSVLDRVSDTGFTERALLAGLSDVRVRFFADGAWLEQWPSGANDEELERLPQALGITLVFATGRSLERLVQIHGAG